MKLVHNIKVSVFSREEEIYEHIRKTALSLIPFDLEKEKVKPKETTAIGFAEKKIKILEIELTKERHTNAFIDNLLKQLNEEQKELLRNQKGSRLDEELFFFIRLDKEKLLNNEYWITDEGNCFHIKMHLAAFPKHRDKALQLVEEIFK